MCGSRKCIWVVEEVNGNLGDKPVWLCFENTYYMNVPSIHVLSKSLTEASQGTSQIVLRILCTLKLRYLPKTLSRDPTRHSTTRRKSLLNLATTLAMILCNERGAKMLPKEAKSRLWYVHKLSILSPTFHSLREQSQGRCQRNRPYLHTCV